jgi:leucyl/phenylalanyl-tRNA---protein transferase
MTDIPYLQYGDAFPHANDANEHGVVAYGGDLTPSRLIDAYKAGIFPWYAPGDPIFWWSPDPRCIMLPQDFIKRKSLDKRIRNGGFEIRFDYDFRSTIRGCREVNDRVKEGTWIVEDMVEAYTILHEMGYAHSIECYLDDELVGGLYGISLGSAFFGESMFAKVADASKVAYAALVEFALEHGFTFIDCQVPTDHLLSLGAICVERELFLEILEDSLNAETLCGSWAVKLK